MKNYIFIIILVFVSGSDGKPFLVAKFIDTKKYWDQCPLPSLQEMKDELSKEFSRKKTIGYHHTTSLSGLSFIGERIEYINIDGFLMKRPSDEELNMLLALTSHSESFASSYLDSYKTEKKLKGKTLYIKRSFDTGLDTSSVHGLGNSPIYNLQKVKNEKPYCSSLICAANRIFGKKKSILIIYAMEKYGLHLSKYASSSATEEGLSFELLKTLLMVAQSTPQHLIKSAFKGESFYIETKDNQGGLANSGGYISRGIYDKSKFYTTAIITHEVGHRISAGEHLNHSPKLSLEQWWLRVAGFDETGTKNESLTNVSGYADTSSEEGFAESYLMYRFAPKKFKENFPKRYRYMKERVFDDLEYREDFMCHPLYLN